jgi:2-keto-3-deoxy-6-phosphogluconate aldolase
VLAAWQAGPDLVKISPWGLMGGPKHLRALKDPFPNIKFLPT